MPRPIKSHLLTSYLATVALALAAPAAHADRPGWLALHTPWRHSLSSRLFTAAPSFGPAVSLPSAPVGNLPQFAAENYSTHTLYVVNSNDNTVSVLNLATCNSRNLSGCARPSPTIDVGQFPLGVAVDEATDTVYVANAVDGTVSVIDGSRCNASDSSGCGQTPTTVAVGAFDNALIVDPVTNTVFVTNSGESTPGTVSVIDGNSCNGTDQSGCAAQPEAAVSVGDGPSGIGVNPVTNTIYVTNTGFGGPVPDGHTVSVVDGARCRAGDLSGCTSIGTVPVGLGPINLTIDPTTNTVYLGDTYADTAGHGFITVLNGATCDAADQSGCGSDAHPIVTVGADPIGYAVDPNNHSVYVTNASDDTVSVIDDTNCNAKPSAGCKNPPPTIAVPGSPSWPVVDPATHTIYVVDQADNNVAVLNDNSCDAKTTAGCRHPAPTAPAGSFPNAATTDTHFGTVYVGDSHAFQPPYTITMIDAARCNASDLSVAIARRARCLRSEARSASPPTSAPTRSTSQRTDRFR